MRSDDTDKLATIPCPHCGERTDAPLTVILGGGEATCARCHQTFTVESSVPTDKQERMIRNAKANP
jgi:uncharacterized paraquat-inducible protein A